MATKPKPKPEPEPNPDPEPIEEEPTRQEMVGRIAWMEGFVKSLEERITKMEADAKEPPIRLGRRA